MAEHSSNFDFSEVIETLKKNPKERSAIQLDKIINQTKDIPFFKKYISEGDKDVHENCCKFMRLEKFETNQPVFEIDSLGTKFYLIIMGQAGVYIRLPRKVIDEENKEDMQALTCVKVLQSGEAFGELALLNNKPRLASIISLDTTYLAVLEKKDFITILKDKEEQKLIREMGFFAKLPIFTGWSSNLVKLLYLNVFRVKFKKNEYVFQEGQEPLAVYIITEGEFDIQMNFEKKESDQPWLLPNENDVDALKATIKKKSTILRISSYVPHELFGEEDIMNNESKRKFSAICSSANGECIMIKKRDFFLRIMSQEASKQYLNERLRKKNKLFSEKQEKIRDQIVEYSNYFYNDGDKIKKEKDTCLILKNEQFKNEVIDGHKKRNTVLVTVTTANEISSQISFETHSKISSAMKQSIFSSHMQQRESMLFIQKNSMMKFDSDLSFENKSNLQSSNDFLELNQQPLSQSITSFTSFTSPITNNIHLPLPNKRPSYLHSKPLALLTPPPLLASCRETFQKREPIREKAHINIEIIKEEDAQIKSSRIQQSISLSKIVNHTNNKEEEINSSSKTNTSKEGKVKSHPQIELNLGDQIKAQQKDDTIQIEEDCKKRQKSFRYQTQKLNQRNQSEQIPIKLPIKKQNQQTGIELNDLSCNYPVSPIITLDSCRSNRNTKSSNGKLQIFLNFKQGNQFSISKTQQDTFSPAYNKVFGTNCESFTLTSEKKIKGVSVYSNNNIPNSDQKSTEQIIDNSNSCNNANSNCQKSSEMLIENQSNRNKRNSHFQQQTENQLDLSSYQINERCNSSNSNVRQIKEESGSKIQKTENEINIIGQFEQFNKHTNHIFDWLRNKNIKSCKSDRNYNNKFKNGDMKYFKVNATSTSSKKIKMLNHDTDSNDDKQLSANNNQEIVSQSSIYFNSLLLQQNQSQERAATPSTSIPFSTSASSFKNLLKTSISYDRSPNRYRFIQTNNDNHENDNDKNQNEQPNNNEKEQVSNQKQQKSPEKKQIKGLEFKNDYQVSHRKLKILVSTESEQDLNRKKALFEKQHLSSTQRFKDIFQKRLATPIAGSTQNRQTRKMTPQSQFPSSSRFISPSYSSSGLFDKLNLSLSIGTQFSSILKQLDKSSFQASKPKQ